MIKVTIFLVRYRNIDSIMKAFAMHLSGQGCMANPDKRPEPKRQPIIRVLLVSSYHFIAPPEADFITKTRKPESTKFMLFFRVFTISGFRDYGFLFASSLSGLEGYNYFFNHTAVQSRAMAG